MVDFLLAAPTATEWHATCSVLSNPTAVDGSQPTKAGRIGRYQVVCTQLGKGIARAAANLTSAIYDHKPRWIILLGVAGGFADKKVVRGDILVAEFVYGYEFGKLEGGVLTHRPDYDFHPDASLLAYAEALVEAPDQRWLQRVTTVRPDEKESSATALHVGYVASGDKLVDQPDHPLFQELKRQIPALHGVEMEGAGANAAVRLHQAKTTVGFLMVRGISDEPAATHVEGGTAQRKQWKEYAATCAAVFVAELIERFPGKAIVANPPATPDADPVISAAAEDVATRIKAAMPASPWIRTEEESVTLTPISGARRRALNLEPTSCYACDVRTIRTRVSCGEEVTICFRAQDIEPPNGVDFDLILGKGLLADATYDEICRGIGVRRLKEYLSVRYVRASHDNQVVEYVPQTPEFQNGYFLVRYKCPQSLTSDRYDTLQIGISTFIHRSVGWYTYYTTNSIIDRLLASFTAPFRVACKVNFVAPRQHFVDNQRLGSNYYSEVTFDGPIPAGASADWIFLGGEMASGKGSGGSGGKGGGGNKGGGGGRNGTTQSGGGGVIKSGGGGVTSTGGKGPSGGSGKK